MTLQALIQLMLDGFVVAGFFLLFVGAFFALFIYGIALFIVFDYFKEK